MANIFMYKGSRHPPKIVSRTASGENGQNNAGRCGCRAWEVFACAEGKVLRGKIIPAQVLPVLQGKGPCGKEAFLVT